MRDSNMQSGMPAGDATNGVKYVVAGCIGLLVLLRIAFKGRAY